MGCRHFGSCDQEWREEQFWDEKGWSGGFDGFSWYHFHLYLCISTIINAISVRAYIESICVFKPTYDLYIIDNLANDY